MKTKKLLIGIGIFFTLFCALSQIMYPYLSIWGPAGFAGGAWLIIGFILLWNRKHGIK